MLLNLNKTGPTGSGKLITETKRVGEEVSHG